MKTPIRNSGRRRARAHGSPVSTALMGMELAFYSWETIVRRGMLMASGQCSPAEYQKMVTEKAAAFGKAAINIASARPDAIENAMAAIHATAKANARRLRK
jgi:hypothetical protein